MSGWKDHVETAREFVDKAEDALRKARIAASHASLEAPSPDDPDEYRVDSDLEDCAGTASVLAGQAVELFRRLEGAVNKYEELYEAPDKPETEAAEEPPPFPDDEEDS